MPFNELLGIRLVRAHQDGVTIACKVRPQLLNASGVQKVQKKTKWMAVMTMTMMTTTTMMMMMIVTLLWKRQLLKTPQHIGHRGRLPKKKVAFGGVVPGQLT
jgi:hypothetical protein